MREFRLPDVGEGVAEGELLDWKVRPGDRVSEDQVVAEVETDKAVVDVPSPVDGVVRELHAQPGDVVPVGDVLVTFDVDGEDGEIGADEGTADATDAKPDDGPDAAAAGGEPDGEPAGDGRPGGRVFAPPSVRELARDLGVDLARVEGSGPGGRVTAADVRAAADGREHAAAGSAGNGSERGDADDGLKSVVTRVESADGTDGGDRGGDGEAAGTAGTAGPEPAGRDRTLAVPATRRVADELGVDIDDVPATEQRDGEAFVTEADVREYAQAQQAAQAADAAELAAGGATAEAEAGAGAETETATATAADEATATATAAGERERREPYRGVRKTIGEAMERSKFTAPHVTHHETVDATGLVEVRERLKPRAEQEGVNLTYLPFVMKAVVAALKEHPVLNAALDEENDEIVYKQYYDIGVATATDAGLMVPVVEGVDEKGLVEVAAEVRDLTGKARDRSIAREKLQGSTFTVTNFGAIGGEYATPIINYPEVAILGLGAIEKRPRVVDDEVVARHTLPLSLSIDHRVVDGADAARFVDTLADYLEDPALLLLE